MHLSVMSSLGRKRGLMLTWRRSANCSDLCFSPSGCDKMVEFPGFVDLSGDSNWNDGDWDKKIGSMECEVDYPAHGR
jgi:hypothetical protein